MTTTTDRPVKTIGQILGRVALVADTDERTELTWYYLRQMFPGSSDAALAIWAAKIERELAK